MSHPTFDVQAKPCATCIYSSRSPLDIQRLEAEVADPHMPGFFAGYRVCHHTAAPAEACCAGFWARYKDRITLGQIAQRLGWVRKVRRKEHHP